MSNRKGFTLIELLIVVVIIGILAAIAIPKFANTKEKAVVAGMKSDLRNMVTAQEGFFSDNQTYATAFGAVQANAPATPACGGTVAFGPTQGNLPVFAGGCTAAGWAMTVTNPAVTSASNNVCGIYVGDPATFAPLAGLAATDTEGAPKCY
ncbi:MAG: prepilin-type N-terminal cleavage/methylation domain-containing protein [Gemmatimonadales bacterium]